MSHTLPTLQNYQTLTSTLKFNSFNLADRQQVDVWSGEVCEEEAVCTLITIQVSGMGAVVKVVDSHPCGWGSILGKSCSFSRSLLKQELITVLHVF